MPSASKNIFWLSFSRVIAMTMLAVAYFALFRYLGPENSGRYQFVLSYSTLFGVVVDLGLAQYIIKKMSEFPDKVNHYFRHFLAIESILCLLVYGGLLGSALFFGFERVVVQAIAVYGIGMVLAGLQYPFLAVMSSHSDLKKVAYINFLASLANVFIITLAIVFHLGIVFLAINTTLSGICAVVLYIRFTRSYLPRFQLRNLYSDFEKQELRKIFIAAFPFAMLTGFATIYNRIDIVLVSKMLGFTQAGYYTAAYKFVDLMNFFPAVVSHVLYPVFAQKIAQKDFTGISAIIEKYIKLTFFAAVPVGVAASLLSDKIILVLAGQEFAPGASALTLLAFAVTVLIAYIVINPIMIAQMTRVAVLLTLLNVSINILGNLVLLPTLGIQAAALMTVVCESLQLIGYFYFVNKYVIKFSFMKTLVKVVIGGCAMAASIIFLKSFGVHFGISHYLSEALFEIIVYGGVGGVVYCLVLWLLSYTSLQEIKSLRN